MSVVDDLLRELSWEASLSGEYTFEYKDDFLWRLAEEYERLPDTEAGELDRQWLQMICMVVLGLVPPGLLMEKFGKELEDGKP